MNTFFSKGVIVPVSYRDGAFIVSKWCLKDKGKMHEKTKNDNLASMHGYVSCIGNLVR